MVNGLLPGLVGLAMLAPAAVYAFIGRGRGSTVFWAVALAGLLGAGAGTAGLFGPAWNAGFPAALWLIVFVSLAVFLFLALFNVASRPLALILFPYAFLLAALATLWQALAAPEPAPLRIGGWLAVHIPVSLLTYAFLTLAAAAALAVLLRETALKNKHTTGFIARLPAVAEGEALELRLLLAAEAVMLLGLVSGMAALYAASGRLLVLDHKTLLSLLVFVLLAAIILLHYVAGVRGRFGARLLLVAYLFLTLAYPGVKFVLDVVIGR